MHEYIKGLLINFADEPKPEKINSLEGGIPIQDIFNRLKPTKIQGLPGGAVVKNPPADAGDTGSSPGPGRSFMPRSNEARAPQLLSLRSRARKPQLLSPRATTAEACVPRARAPQQEKPPQ